MSWRVYKCNSTEPPWAHGVSGDWDTQFFDEDRIRRWGSTEWNRRMKVPNAGDMIIAYQTDRNEIVGVAKAKKSKRRGKYLDVYLEPVERIPETKRPKVSDLRKTDTRIAAIPALRPGPIKTIYDISASDARYLLNAAGLTSIPDVSPREDRSKGGRGFGGDEEHKKKVEMAAMGFITRYYKSRRWKVEDVSDEKGRGYDLICSRGGRYVHVEVKGSSGPEESFSITSGEKESWSTDKRYVLALVTNALDDPQPHFYEGTEAMKDFVFDPTSYIAKKST